MSDVTSSFLYIKDDFQDFKATVYHQTSKMWFFFLKVFKKLLLLWSLLMFWFSAHRAGYLFDRWLLQRMHSKGTNGSFTHCCWRLLPNFWIKAIFTSNICLSSAISHLMQMMNYSCAFTAASYHCIINLLIYLLIYGFFSFLLWKGKYIQSSFSVLPCKKESKSISKKSPLVACWMKNSNKLEFSLFFPYSGYVLLGYNHCHFFFHNRTLKKQPQKKIEKKQNYPYYFK